MALKYCLKTHAYGDIHGYMEQPAHILDKNSAKLKCYQSKTVRQNHVKIAKAENMPTQKI